MIKRRARLNLVLVLLLAVTGSACSAHWAYRQGQAEGRQGNWDLAVARYQRALLKSPDNIRYRIALENARTQAAIQHYETAKKALAAEELEKAADELEIAVKYDGQNKSAADDLRITRQRIQKRQDEKEQREGFEALKTRAAAVRVPTPVLSPRSPAPISLKFTDHSLEKVFDTLGKLAGVNMVMDTDFRDKKVSINVVGVTFEEALNQLTFLNRLFYKVLDQNTLVIVPESPQKRRSYDDLLVQTFYLQNADSKEVTAVVKGITGIQKVVENPTLGAITVTGTPDQIALAERVIAANDKARGEVMVEVRILEVRRARLKDYGIRLAGEYQAGVTYSPFGTTTTTTGTGGSTTTAAETLSPVANVRAHVLSSLSLSDFVVSIPAQILARFLETETSVQLLASPKLRAAEGKKTQLKIVSQVPVATATFGTQVPTTPGANGFVSTTQIQYRDVGVTLELTPKIAVSGDITLEMTAEFSLLGEPASLGGQDQPTFLTRNLNGILRLRDGETSLIGGLMQGREGASWTGALGLRSVPIINKILGGQKREKDDTEILISITPHIVRAPKVVEEDLRPMYVGTLETLRVPSARPPLFGLAEPAVRAPGAAPGAPTAPTSGGVAAPGSPTSTPPASGSPASGAAPSGSGASKEAPAPPWASPGSPTGATVPTAPGPSAAPTEGGPPSTSPQDGGTSTPASVPQARFAPAAANVRVGQSGALGLVLLNAKDVIAVEVALSYDPSLIEALDVGPGALLSLDGVNVGVERQIDAGRVRARFTRPTGGSGSGAVAMFSFKALRPGTSAVLVEAMTVTTPAGVLPVPVGGQGRVGVTE